VLARVNGLKRLVRGFTHLHSAQRVLIFVLEALLFDISLMSTA